MASLVIGTFFTTTVVPVWLVTRIHAEFAPTPLEISKKLYVIRVAVVQEAPWLVETSILEVRRWALTTWAENQYSDTPDF